MTAILRPQYLIIGLLVLAQAAALAWLGDRMSPWSAAAVLMAGMTGVIVLPAAGFQALARTRTLARNLEWWHWLWIFLFFSELVFRQRDVQTLRDNPLDSWAIYRVALVGLAGLVLLWRIASRRGEWLSYLFSGLILAMATYPIAGVASTAWSIFPAWTAYRSLELLVDVSVIAAAISAAGSLDRLKSLFDLTWLLMYLLQASVWAGAILAPEKAWFATEGSLRLQLNGVIPDIGANGVGHIAAILSIVALSRLLGRRGQGRLLYTVMFLSSLATLIMAQTRSALTGFMIASAIVLLLAGRSWVLLATAYVAVVLLLATSAESTFLQYFRRGQNAQLWGSLSGRTTWWSFAWARLMERPLTGFGAFAGGRFAALAEMGNNTTSSVHNSYLEAVLGIGLGGIIPLLICMVGVWWRSLQSFFNPTSNPVEQSLRLEAIGVLAVVSVRSVFTTDLIWHAALPWLLVLGYAEMLRRQAVALEAR